MSVLSILSVSSHLVAAFSLGSDGIILMENIDFSWKNILQKKSFRYSVLPGLPLLPSHAMAGYHCLMPTASTCPYPLAINYVASEFSLSAVERAFREECEYEDIYL